MIVGHHIPFDDVKGVSLTGSPNRFSVLNSRSKLGSEGAMPATIFSHLLWLRDEYQLTIKELEVVAHVLRASSTKKIACDLGLKANTVEAHRANIRKKMRVCNTAGIFAAVMRGPRTGCGAAPQREKSPTA